LRSAVHDADLEEGEPVRPLVPKKIGERQDIVDPKTSADGRLSVFEGIPGKPDSRFKIPQRGILEERVPHGGGWIRDVMEMPQLSVDFLDGCGRFVTQAEIEGKIRAKAKVVLQIPGNDRGAKAPSGIRAGNCGGEGLRNHR